MEDFVPSSFEINIYLGLRDCLFRKGLLFKGFDQADGNIIGLEKCHTMFFLFFVFFPNGAKCTKSKDGKTI